MQKVYLVIIGLGAQIGRRLGPDPGMERDSRLMRGTRFGESADKWERFSSPLKLPSDFTAFHMEADSTYY